MYAFASLYFNYFKTAIKWVKRKIKILVSFIIEIKNQQRHVNNYVKISVKSIKKNKSGNNLNLSIKIESMSRAEQVSFSIGVHSMQSWTITMKHRVTTKRSTKRLKHTGNLVRKNLKAKRCLAILDLKPLWS